MLRRHLANENDHVNIRALISIAKDDGRSLFITMPFIHQMAPFYFAQLRYADYDVMLRIKWPCFPPKIVTIRAAFLKLLAEIAWPHLIWPTLYIGSTAVPDSPNS